MAAINALVARDLLSRQLAKRENWAQQEKGVIVVFCIVFVVAVGLIILWIYKCLQKRKAKKETLG
jgi:ATP/ADP translocase